MFVRKMVIKFGLLNNKFYTYFQFPSPHPLEYKCYHVQGPEFRIIRKLLLQPLHPDLSSWLTRLLSHLGVRTIIYKVKEWLVPAS